VGLNTWATAGAPAPPPGAAGLREFVLALPDRAAVDGVVARARGSRVAVEERPDGFALADPSGNHLLLSAAPATAERPR
jgi:catechol 2,3-dioxygenase